MTLDRKHVFYMEDGCDFTRVKEIDHNVFYIHSSCGGEGMTNESAVFQLLPNDRIRISHHSLQWTAGGLRRDWGSWKRIYVPLPQRDASGHPSTPAVVHSCDVKLDSIGNLVEPIRGFANGAIRVAHISTEEPATGVGDICWYLYRPRGEWEAIALPSVSRHTPKHLTIFGVFML
jgi:hypothetical protein